MLVLLISLLISAAPLTVVIDPGHGGTDTGAVNGKIKEAEIALKVSQELKTILDADPLFRGHLTRNSDKMLSLPERVAFAENIKAHLFLSVHANAANDSRAKGVEFYFQNHLPPDEETLFLAATENKMLKQLEKENDSELEPTKKNDVLSIIEDLKRQNRMAASLYLSQKLLISWDQDKKLDTHAIRQAPFYVVSKTQMPSVLIELGFITNPKEAAKLADPEHQKQIAKKIYEGLKLYKEKLDKRELGPLKSRL